MGTVGDVIVNNVKVEKFLRYPYLSMSYVGKLRPEKVRTLGRSNETLPTYTCVDIEKEILRSPVEMRGIGRVGTGGGFPWSSKKPNLLLVE